MSTLGRQTVRWKGMPPLQLDPDDVRSGTVKVYARSPSGRNQLMEVVETDGMYNANFTPDEVGKIL